MRQKCKDCMLCGIDRVTNTHYCLATSVMIAPRYIRKLHKNKVNRFNDCPQFRRRLYSSGLLWEELK